MLKHFATLLLTLGVCYSSAYADSAVEQALQETTSYPIAGTFSPYDFEPTGDNNPFDWAYTVLSSGKVYQLQGIAPTEESVFGWKEVAIQPSAPQPSMPMWYMFRLKGDVDDDGTTKFDWVLVSTTQNQSAYKLAGVADDGTFKYSDKLNIDYKVVGNTITTAAAGTFYNNNLPENNESVTENNTTTNVCAPLPQESVGQTTVLRVTKYYDTTSRSTDVVHTLTALNQTSMTVTKEHQSSGITKTETLTTDFSISGNFKDVTKVLSERTGLSPKTITYAPYWREPVNEVCENQTWSFNVNTTVGTSTTSENVTYHIIALTEPKTVIGGTFTTIHMTITNGDETINRWINTQNGSLVYEEIHNNGKLKESTQLISLQ